MQERLLQSICRLAARGRRIVIAVFVALTLFAGAAVSRLTISTSQKALTPTKHPVVQAYQRFSEEFGAADSLIVVLDGAPEASRAVADELAAAIRDEHAWVAGVFYRVDLQLFKDHALWFAPTEMLQAGVRLLRDQRPLITKLATITSLDQILRAIGEAIQAQSGSTDPAAQLGMLGGMSELFAEWTRALGTPAAPRLDLWQRLAAKDSAAGILRAHGYLTSYDQRMLFLFVQPTSASDEATFLRPFLSAVRAASARVLARHPELDGRVKIAYTGLPAHVLTETETVFDDVGRGALFATLLVLLVVWVGFRTPRKMLIAVVPLVPGMVISLGVVALLLGHLNLVSAAFLIVMFGMSIDFGIYLIRRAEEELGAGRSLAAAVEIAMVKTGSGVLTGGLTMTAAFFAVAFSDFVGFAELGITAGVGTFVCLASVFVLTPTLALWLGLEPRPTTLARVHAAAGRTAVKRGLLAILVLSAAAAVGAGFAFRANVFDYNALHLLPKDSESTTYQVRMHEESAYQISAVAVLADSLDELRAVVTRLKAKPTVSRVESAADLFPDSGQPKAEAIAALRPLVDRLEVTYVDRATTVATYEAELKPLSEALAEAQEMAFNGGRSDLVTALEVLLQRLQALAAALGAEDEATVRQRTKAFERELFTAGRDLAALARTWVAIGPVTEADLAPEVLARFKSRAGHYAAYVFPKESIWDIDALDRFVAEVKEVTPRVTGFPITHQLSSRLVVRGVWQAMLYALLAVLLLLFFNFRRVDAVLLALLPLAAGMWLLQLVLWLLDIPYNYANLAAFPVLLGYGVSYGVNIVQRWRERPTETAFVAAYTVGKGVLLSAAAAAAALVSIVPARHAGVSTFGTVLLAGILLCFATAVLLLPAAIDLLIVRGRGDPDATP
ncbi:MAG: MMPL family transporter [Deltaproteobacteria bacterium]|nr:MMPL family transporter [Deltaproteobacteria bacterium]